MGALRRAGVWLGLVEEDDERLYDGRYADEFAGEDGYPAPPRPPRTRPASAREAAPPERPTRSGPRDARVAERLDRAERERLAEPPQASVRPLAGSRSGALTYSTQENLALVQPPARPRERGVVADEKGRRHQIITLHPTTYREARTIGERFREGVPVIINLTDMDEPDARRLVDFAAGLTFGLRGSIERVTNRVFLLSPANVQVTAEEKAKIAEGGFFDQG